MPEIVDFSHGIRREPGETILSVTHRVKRLALQRDATKRLGQLVTEFSNLALAYEKELPEGEATQALEQIVAADLGGHRMVLLLLDEKTARKHEGSAPELLSRLHETASQ